MTNHHTRHLSLVLLAAMMLRHSFKLEEEARAIERAVEETLALGLRTADLGGKARTSEVGQAVRQLLRRGNNG